MFLDTSYQKIEDDYQRGSSELLEALRFMPRVDPHYYDMVPQWCGMQGEKEENGR